MVTPNYGYPMHLERRDELRAVSAMSFRAAFGEIEYPDEIDLRGALHVEYQEQIGSCQGHALMSVCELAGYMANNQLMEFSNWFGYLGSQKIDGLLGRDVGSTLSGGRELVTKYGCCPLDVMPYPNPAKYPRNPQVPTEAYVAAAQFKIRNSMICENYDDVFHFMGSGQGGVQIGINWNDTMTPNRDGVIESYSPNRRGGGHSVAFIGYVKQKDKKNRKYLILLNSWDVTWGDDGYAIVAPAAVDAMFQHQFTVMHGLTDLSVPTPRRPDYSPW